MRFLHCADLHLSMDEKEYSLAVLEEILSLASAEGCSALIFAGDTFDSFEDMEQLRADFRKQVEPLEIPLLFIPGNHEKLKAGNRNYKSLDLGKITAPASEPLLLNLEDTEFILIPFMESYSLYRSWTLPGKVLPCRVVVIHGSVSGMTFTGLDGEGTSSAIDTDLFERFEADYAALGHIHTAKREKPGKVLLNYPGSARVWRKGEAGKRKVSLVETGPEIRVKDLPIKNAGEYRFINLSLENLKELPELETKPEDYLEISLSGVTDNEGKAAEAEEKIKELLKTKVRRLEVDRSRVIVIEEMGKYPIVKRFIELWRKHRPPEGDTEAEEVWYKARDLALLKIKDELRHLND